MAVHEHKASGRQNYPRDRVKSYNWRDLCLCGAIRFCTATFKFGAWQETQSNWIDFRVVQQ